MHSLVKWHNDCVFQFCTENLANGEPLHITTSLSMDSICHGSPKSETEQVPKPRPRTAPKPKSRSKTDFVEETKSVPSMISSLLIADTLPVVGSIDSDISLEDCKAGNISEAKVSAIIADLRPKHGLVIVSGNQAKAVPVKPPRPKKAQKQTTLCASDAFEAVQELPPTGERDGESHDVEKKQSQKINPKPKPKVLVNVQEPNGSLTERGSSSASADCGRLYRTASYERALEDDVFGSSSTEAEHLKDNEVQEEEEEKKQKTDTMLSAVKTSVSDTNISGNYLGPEPVKGETVISKKERVLGNVQDLPLGDRKGFGIIQPNRVAPPPPSKTNAPMLKRLPKVPGLKGVAHNYVDLQSKSLTAANASMVKRSSSDCIGNKSGKPGQAKQKHRKKSGDGEKGKSENGRHSESVFYVNLDNVTSGLIKNNLAIDEAPHCEKKMHVDSDDYLMPVVDSQTVGASEGNANSDKFYENVQAITPRAKTRSPSLDTMIPAPGKTLEPMEEIEPDNLSTNTYYEISELDTPVLIQTSDGALDEEGYSMIAENSDVEKRNSENIDTDYIYPESWTQNSKLSRVSDTYIYPVDEAGKALSPKPATGEKSVAVVRPRPSSELSFVSEESDSRRSSLVCDSALQSPACNSSLSRSSSALSNSAFQMTDACPSELTEEDIKVSSSGF